MAQFAPVAPIQILERMEEVGILGTYHLLLAHHVLEHPDRFKALFMGKSQCTIIMDNSIVELGDAENEAKVLEACQIIQGDADFHHYIIPVLTDVMGNGEETRSKTETSYNWWQENAPEYPLMAVLQGGGEWNTSDAWQSVKDRLRTWQDFVATADKFLLGDYHRIEYVGIPRILTDYTLTRAKAIQYVEAIRPDVSVHLLGFSEDPTDDLICANHPSIEGIDSAVPIRFGPNYTPSSVVPKRDPKWFAEGEYADWIEQNLYNVRKWVA